MKHLKTKKQLKEESYKLYGGLNTNNIPFNIGDKLKQIWRFDDEDNLIKDGREECEFVGMKGDMMLLKTLNSYAAYQEDIFNREAVEMQKKIGYKPFIGDVRQLHYVFADRFEVIQN